MPSTYPVEFTRIARALAGKRIGAIEEQVRGEIAELLGDAPVIADLLFHVVQTPDGRLWHCAPDGDRLIVDACNFEEADLTLKDGPFAGNKVMLPRKSTEEDE